MQNKNYLALIIIGLLLITIIPLTNTVKADSTATITYYFNGHSEGGLNWSNYPQYMYDGNNYTFASPALGTDGEWETLAGTTCSGTSLGTITDIKIRVRGKYAGVGTAPSIFFSVNSGVVNSYEFTTLITWSPYFSVLSDVSTWNGVKNAEASIECRGLMIPLIMYCARVELQVTYIKPSSVLNIISSSVYPINNSYTHKNVTLSWNCTAGGQYNYTLYKKIGSGSYFLSDAKTNQAAGTTMFYKRWFNATSLNTLYTWKVCMKNYTINNWKNFSFHFYINDSTVHLSDTKTNVAGTLTSLRNNTGFYITSIHNSSITKRDRTVNSSLTHVYFWVTNTWVDYANSTGTTTPFTYHNNTLNVSSVKQLKLLSNGYHLWDNSSSGILSYTNFINCTGTLQKAWYPLLGKFKAWANVTGTDTPVHLIENIVNASGSHILIHNSTGYYINATYTGYNIGLVVVNNSNNVTGTIQYLFNPYTGLHGEWWVFVNLTGVGGNVTPSGYHFVNIHLFNFSGKVKWNGTYSFNTTNISFNASSNVTEYGNISINEDDYFMSGILTFENTQFFLMILIGLWCFFIVEYYTHKELLFAFVQLLFAFPLTLYLAGITFFTGQLMILPLLFIIPLLSLYIVIDGFFYRTHKKV